MAHRLSFKWGFNGCMVKVVSIKSAAMHHRSTTYSQCDMSDSQSPVQCINIVEHNAVIITILNIVSLAKINTKAEILNIISFKSGISCIVQQPRLKHLCYKLLVSYEVLPKGLSSFMQSINR